MTASQPLLSRRIGHVLILSIHNPGKRNAIAPGLHDALRAALAEAESQPEIGAVVLTGAGYFCAGGDLRQIDQRRLLDLPVRRERLSHLHDVVRRMRDFPKPIVAAVEGGAAGAGFSLALACDLVVAAAGASFSVAYVKVGLTPDGGITGLLAQSLPRQLLTRLALTGEGISAEALHRFGVVGELVPVGQAESVAIALAMRLAQGPQRSMAAIKGLCRAAYERSLDEQLDAESDAMVAAQVDAESAEGIAAFFGKRPADYLALRSGAAVAC